jgi:predicted negative regulator of RcsB-dependent stress response
LEAGEVEQFRKIWTENKRTLFVYLLNFKTF